MSTFYASYPPTVSSGGITDYATFGDFPTASSVSDGTLALALDTRTLYESNGTNWAVIGGPGVPLSIGTFDSGTPSANGAHIDTNALIMQSASATVPGLVNTSTQTLAGVKTFSSAPNLSSLTASLPLQLDGSKNMVAQAIDLSGSQATGILAAGRFPALTGDVTTVSGALATSLVATTNSTLTTLSGLTTAASLATVGTITSGTWSGTTIALNKGGTGQTTKAAAFDALSPMTTAADLIYGGIAGTGTRLGIGSSGNVLTVSGGNPVWAPPATSGTVTSVAMTVPTFLSVSGSPVTSSGTLAVSLSGTALPVANGGTGLTSGTSGGILGYTASGTLASSGALTASQLIIGGGAGVTPSTLAAGSQFQVLVMGAANPGYGQVNLSQSAAITGTLPIGNGGSGQVTANAALNAFLPSQGGNSGKGLTTDGSNTAWTPIVTNPMTTAGDIIVGGASGTPARLAIGVNGQALRAGASTLSYSWNNVNTVSSADYTVLSTDGYDVIAVSTGASTRTVTLPASASSAGRRLVIEKTDSGTGSITVARAGSDTINGATSYTVAGQYGNITLLCSGTDWEVLGYSCDITHASTWGPNGTSPTNSSSVNLRVTRSMNQVTIFTPNVTDAVAGTLTSTTLLSLQTALPSWAVPAVNKYFMMGVPYNAGAYDSTFITKIELLSSGGLRVYKNFAESSFTASLGCGFFNFVITFNAT